MIKNLFLIFVPIGLLFSFYGCAHDTYYRPSSDVGKIYKSVCHGEMGFPNGVIFVHGRDRVLLRTHQKTEKPEILVLQLSVEFYEKKRIEFDSSLFYVTVSGEIKQHEFQTIRAHNFGPIVPETILPFVPVIPETSYEHYIFTAEFPMLSDAFAIQLPKLRINEILFDFGLISFRKESGWAIMPLNC